MAKMKVILPIKAAPSPYYQNVLKFQEHIFDDFLEGSNISICVIYRFIGNEFVSNSFEFKQIVQCIRTGRVQKILFLLVQMK